MCKDLEKYWYSIPVGAENAVTYSQLEIRWGMCARRVRNMLSELSRFDNGDNYILIRSSRRSGFYRTDDPADIAAYKRECKSRAINTFSPLNKINRVMKDSENVNYSFFNNIQTMRRERGISQATICTKMQSMGIKADVSLLSKIESGYALPTPAQLHALALILSCEPSDILSMELDSLNIFCS